MKTLLEVPIIFYNRLPVTIDIGHQSQGHFHFAMNLAIASLLMVVWARGGDWCSHL